MFSRAKDSQNFLWGHHIVPQKAADVNIILSFIEMIGQPKATSNGITKTGRCINNYRPLFLQWLNHLNMLWYSGQKSLAPKIGQLILMIFPNEMVKIWWYSWWYGRLQPPPYRQVAKRRRLVPQGSPVMSSSSPCAATRRLLLRCGRRRMRWRSWNIRGPERMRGSKRHGGFIVMDPHGS